MPRAGVRPEATGNRPPRRRQEFSTGLDHQTVFLDFQGFREPESPIYKGDPLNSRLLSGDLALESFLGFFNKNLPHGLPVGEIPLQDLKDDGRREECGPLSLFQFHFTSTAKPVAFCCRGEWI